MVTKARCPIVLTCNYINKEIRKLIDSTGNMGSQVHYSVSPSVMTVIAALHGVAMSQGIDV